MKMRCPICQSEREVPADYELRPFCSSRCKKVDLGNWLDGNYCLPRELYPEELAELPEAERDEILERVSGEATGRLLH